MAKKIYDLAVKTGSYTDKTGQQKGRYQNIGAMMESDDGSCFIMLNAWFNPAGVARKEGAESVLVSCFVPRQTDGQEQQRTAPTRAKTDNFEEDIPF